MITTSEEIKNRLWAGANELRGSMDASRYKDYMLGLMFYKFLSDKTLSAFKILAHSKAVSEDDLVDEYTAAYEKMKDKLISSFSKEPGYYVAPEYLYQTWMREINKGKFEVQNVTDGFNNFERTIVAGKDSDDFKGLFANSTLDLSDTALGASLKDRSNNIQSLIKLFSDLDMVTLQSGDVLGDAYEYLIGMFAMESGKKAGEFYTPRKVSTVLAKIVAKTAKIESVYDPAVGSGSLLLTVGKQLDADEQKTLNYYGQEKNTATYNLTRMNLLLHNVSPKKMTIKNGDTLSQDWPEDPAHPNEGVQFDAVVMNPPYSAKNWNKAGLKVSDPRFESFGVLPPDGKGDYAFLLHGLYHLGQEGTMAIVLPHGVLFRGATEGDIRKRLIEKNNIDAVIGMPAGMFTNTSIPVLVMILRKNRKLTDPVLIIDASKSFKKEGKQNVLREKDIAKIVDTYITKAEIEKYSHLATRDEIVGNDYNLNIPRYVDSSEEDLPQDVDGHLYGGIPMSNIEYLKTLNQIVPDIIKAALKEIRPGYVELTKPVADLSKEILESKQVEKLKKSIVELSDQYISKYWDILRGLGKDSNVRQLNEDMLTEIKDVFEKNKLVDEYDAYQIIADIWNDILLGDAELIKAEGFYTAGRTKVENMITKGSGDKKRTEQDGFKGEIIPNELIADNLFSDVKADIEKKQTELADIESSIAEMVESAKEEDTDISNALGECLKDSGDAFDNKLIKEAIKQSDKGSEELKILKNVESEISKKATIAKEIKAMQVKLNEDVQNRIEKLTDEEIDTLVHKKWFGNVTESLVSLLTTVIKSDIDTLDMLFKRYSDTLTELDKETEALEEELNKMMSEMVVTE